MQVFYLSKPKNDFIELDALRNIVRRVGLVVEIAVIPYLFGFERPPNTES